MTDGRFPLLRLPQEDILRVVKSMDIFEIILLSFSSKRSKLLVESAGLKYNGHPAFLISDQFELQINVPDRFTADWVFSKIRNSQPNHHPPTELPVAVKLRVGKNSYKFQEVQMELKDWVNHVKSIFHARTILLVFLTENRLFDIKSIKSVVGESHGVYILFPGTAEQNMEKFEAFPMVRELALGVWQDRRPPSSAFIHNFDFFSIGSKHITLDDVSLVNSKWSTVKNIKFSEKDVNRYLKLWMRGRVAWNVEKMGIALEMGGGFDVAAVLKGIDFKEGEYGRARRFKPASGRRGVLAVRGGYDIRRKDGIIATITFTEHRMEMFVWHSYCVGESDEKL